MSTHVSLSRNDRPVSIWDQVRLSSSNNNQSVNATAKFEKEKSTYNSSVSLSFVEVAGLEVINGKLVSIATKVRLASSDIEKEKVLATSAFDHRPVLWYRRVVKCTTVD